MRRAWPHIVGITLCAAAFCSGYYVLAGHLAFWPTLNESIGVPLAGMLLMFPYTFLVILLCCVVLAFQRKSRLAMIAVYAVFAAYWSLVAYVMHDIDL